MVDHPDRIPPSNDQRPFAPAPLWAGLEVLLAVAVIGAGLTLPIPAFMLGSATWLMVIGVALVWWRGPGWRVVGLGLSSVRTIAIASAIGIAFQFVGTFAFDPLIARLTSGELPDVSTFRSIVGNERQLAYWVVLGWSLGACVEEVAYRGWIMNRLAEVGRFSPSAWMVAVLASSVLFGVIHLYQGLSGVIATGLSGVVFAMVYVVTGRNLWAAIVTHGVSNTTSFVLMYLGRYPGL